MGPLRLRSLLEGAVRVGAENAGLTREEIEEDSVHFEAEDKR